MKKAIELLITHYQNEKNTEEILPYNQEIIDFYQKTIPILTNHMISLTNPIVKSIIEQELERTKYFLKNYLLTRLKKISLKMKINLEFLSEAEKIFYEKMINFYKEEDIFVDEESVCDEIVGFISNVSNKRVMLDGKPVELKQGDFFICNVKDVIELVYENEINLI
ncbi:Sld5 domain protein [Tubulinosema ratisbonensis]|uniref:Sld5 domain protein n=1 Tax=Tubulinosema ratisbonensis TaxID=291195 RepID=A0A437APL7_9MICR|nr:Sld5 domain protein [Tubulinosema ratisbonensis]